MTEPHLVLSLPQGTVVATSLGVEGYAQHRSPGTLKQFDGRSVFVDLAIREGRPEFAFLDEGGWRNAGEDTIAAIDAVVRGGKRTKTALSNNGFSCTPHAAWRSVYLGKTDGRVFPLEGSMELASFSTHVCHENLTPAEIAAAAGLPAQAVRRPRMYMVLGPIELTILSNLTPLEYVWYATHRPGKVFRQVAFTEIEYELRGLVAQQVYEEAYDELRESANKKTKTLYQGSLFNKLPFPSWVGYDASREGGLYVGDRNQVRLWRFPARIPAAWARAVG